MLWHISGKEARNPRRRAATAIMVLVTLPVILGMGALAIDVGMMYNTRADLQQAADAAALAGASAYITDTMMKVRLGDDEGGLMNEIQYLVNGRATSTSRLNPSFGTEITAVALNDIKLGWLDVNSATSPIQTGVLPDTHNAIEVTVRRAEDGGNGPLELLFAGIFGVHETDITASATAVFDDRVGGFDVGDSGGALLPFTLHRDVYDADLVSGDDNYGYDPGSESVLSGADGIREINLYPHDVTPGNFGLLNIPNESPEDAASHKEQVENGVAPEDVEADIGSTEFTFYDGEGSAVTYTLAGNPGMETVLEKHLETRIGDVIGFLLHDNATDSGANTDYHVVSIRFGRLVGVKLTGPPHKQGLWVQPAIYAGDGISVDKNAPSSGGTMGRLVLGR